MCCNFSFKKVTFHCQNEKKDFWVDTIFNSWRVSGLGAQIRSLSHLCPNKVHAYLSWLGNLLWEFLLCQVLKSGSEVNVLFPFYPFDTLPFYSEHN